MGSMPARPAWISRINEICTFDPSTPGTARAAGTFRLYGPTGLIERTIG